MTIKTLLEKLRTYRRALHQIPEIGFDVFKTQQYLKQQLESMGYTPIPIVQSGLLVHIKGESDEAIAFRADMDALTIEEENHVSYISRHPGNMHACGHDGHMSMVLGLADILKRVAKPKQSIVLIFQPAEEGPSGAKAIVEVGLLKAYNIKKIFGFHIDPHLEEGLVGLTNGIMMSENSEYDVHITGKSAHAGKAEDGIDAMNAGLHLVQGFKAITECFTESNKRAILNIGTFNAGETRNSVASFARLTGTIRSLNQIDYHAIIEKMRRVVDDIQLRHHVAIQLIFKNHYPAVINDQTLFNTMRQTLNANDYAILAPMMFSEDFSFYQKEIPGLFMMLGSKNISQGLTHPLHNACFNFNEEILLRGVQTYLDILHAYDVLGIQYPLLTSEPLTYQKSV